MTAKDGRRAHLLLTRDGEATLYLIGRPSKPLEQTRGRTSLQGCGADLSVYYWSLGRLRVFGTYCSGWRAYGVVAQVLLSQRVVGGGVEARKYRSRL